MIRDITIGQYYPADSPLHKLDPRTKLMGTLVFIISVFLFHTIPGYAVATVFLAALIKISKVPVKFIFKGLKAIFVILLITMAFNVFLTPGEVIWKLGFLKMTKEGISLAVRMAIRLIYLVIGSSLMTLTTTPNQLTDGLEKGLRPLNRLHVPVHEIAMIMSIALRFIPILLEETDKIMKAQIARGADFENGNLIQKVKNMVPLLVPLFISVFRRANDLAMAMEARCYHGGEERTQMKPLHYEKQDYVTYGILAGLPGNCDSFSGDRNIKKNRTCSCLRRHKLLPGWQIQPNGITIQGVLNDTLSELLGEKIETIGASRTDAGVHALGNVAVLSTETRIPGEKISYALNQRLPEDIRIQLSEEVEPDFHPRYCDSEKTYEYRILNRKFPVPTERLYSYFYHYKLDVEKMKEATSYLIGRHDFASFCGTGAQVKINSAHSDRNRCVQRWGYGDHPCFWRRLFVQHGQDHCRNTDSGWKRSVSAGTGKRDPESLRQSSFPALRLRLMD